MADIIMSLNDTLELDTIIKETGVSSSLNVTDGTKGTDFKLDGIQTQTDIFDPINSGTYNINVNGQELTVKVEDPNNIPSSDIFENPLYRFAYYDVVASNGDTGFNIPEVLAGLPDASSSGSPKYQTSSKYDSGFYDSDNEEYHTFNPDTNLPTGAADLSFAALIKPTLESDGTIVSYGGINTTNPKRIRFDCRSDGSLRMNLSAQGTATTTISANQWYAVGGTLDKNGNVEVYVNGNKEDTGSGSDPNLNSQSPAIGADTDNATNPYDGLIGDIIICDGVESQTSFQEYTNGWGI